MGYKMSNILDGIESGDLIEFDLITSPIEVDCVSRTNESQVTLTFKCHSGYWDLTYKLNGTQVGSGCFAETGIRDAFDIVKVTKKAN